PGHATSRGSWGIDFPARLPAAADAGVTTSGVGGTGAEAGGACPLPPDAQPDRGIGPAPTLSSDNTLGPFSPFEGRICLAYVAKGSNTADDTDVLLAVSDDGGQTWLEQLAVNDDRRVPDGFSGGNRSQFMPE